jgi:hypothetical protein
VQLSRKEGRKDEGEGEQGAPALNCASNRRWDSPDGRRAKAALFRTVQMDSRACSRTKEYGLAAVNKQGLIRIPDVSSPEVLTVLSGTAEARLPTATDLQRLIGPSGTVISYLAQGHKLDHRQVVLGRAGW